MLLEIAAADAYGAVFEGCELDFCMSHNDLTFDATHELPSLVPPGAYTDDTQMSLAVAEALLQDLEWTKEKIADKFVECFQRDKRRGYTTAFLILLINSNTGKELLSKIGGNSTKSGAAMRSCPLGLIPKLQELKEKTIIQAIVTHNSDPGVLSALMVAFATHYNYYKLGDKKDMKLWIEDEISHPSHFVMSKDSWGTDEWYHGDLKAQWNQGNPWVYKIPVPCDGVQCASAAIDAVSMHDNMADILKECVNMGGDTDTTAAIAAGIASVCSDVENNIPESLMSKLENKTYGKDYLKRLDAHLLEKYRKE